MRFNPTLNMITLINTIMEIKIISTNTTTIINTTTYTVTASPKKS